MGTYSTHAIIIGRHNFGEADRIIVLLTPDQGVVRGVAKGVRRIKSRLAGHLELFSESDLMLATGRNLDVITSARLIRHLSTADDYDRMRLAYLFAEMTNRLAGEHESHDGVYGLLQDGFSALAAPEAPTDTVLELWFKLRLLDRLGYRPELDACVACGTSDPTREYLFSPVLGGIVDRACATPGSLPIDQSAIKLWRLMLTRPFAAIAAIPRAAELAKTTMPICNAFYDYTFGQRFRSSAVLT